MKEMISSPTRLDIMATKLKDHTNLDFSISSNILANSNSTGNHTINGDSLWLNINAKNLKEKKKFNTEVSDMLVVEVLKRKELLIENNTSRDLTFSESKRNAWSDVRNLLMEKFPYFDLNVEAIKSHWRYRKRKVTDLYHELKCAESENRMHNKVSILDHAIYRMLKESNMLDKNAKSETSHASPSEGEEQPLESLPFLDRSSLSISPSSAFTAQNHANNHQSKQFQLPPHHVSLTIPNTNDNNVLLQQQGLNELLQNVQFQQQQKQQHHSSNLLQNFGLSHLSPLGSLNSTTMPFNSAVGTNSPAFLDQFTSFFTMLRQQKIHEQQQNIILNSPESSKSVKNSQVSDPDENEDVNVEEIKLNGTSMNDDADNYNKEDEEKSCSTPTVLLKLTSGLETFNAKFQNALNTATKIPLKKAYNVKLTRKRNICHDESRGTIEKRRRNEEDDKSRICDLEYSNISVRVAQKQAFRAQRIAFNRLDSVIRSLKRSLLPEIMKALQNYNSTFETKQNFDMMHTEQKFNVAENNVNLRLGEESNAQDSDYDIVNSCCSDSIEKVDKDIQHYDKCYRTGGNNGNTSDSDYVGDYDSLVSDVNNNANVCYK